MINIINENRIKYLFPRFLIAAIAFFLLKTAFWPLTYLFVLSYTIVIILFLFLLSKGWTFNVINFISKFFIPFTLLAIIIIASFVWGNIFDLYVLKDILLILILFSLFFFLYWTKLFLKQELPLGFLQKLVISIIIIIGILNILKELFSNYLPLQLLASLNISDESTLAIDYNFYCVFMLIGIIYINTNSNLVHFIFSYKTLFLLNLLFIINIFLSGSRRGIVTLIILILFYCIKFIYFFIKNKQFRVLFKYLRNFILLFLLVFLSIGLLVKLTPNQKIAKVLSRYSLLVGFNSYQYFQIIFAKDIPKSKILINKNSFSEQTQYWKNTAQNSLLIKTETPYGVGFEIKRTKGNGGDWSLYYDGPEIIYLANHTYKISFYVKFLKGDYNSFNVGWWSDDGNKYYINNLKKDFKSLNAGWFHFTCQYTFINNHIGLVGFINSVKDDSQFIISNFELTDENFSVDLPQYLTQLKFTNNLNETLDRINPPKYFTDSNLILNGDFTNDLFFWTQSYNTVEFEILEENNIKFLKIYRGIGNNADWSLIYNGENISFIKDNEYELSFKTKLINPKTTVPFNVGFWLDEGNGYLNSLKLKIDTLENHWLCVKVKHKFKADQSNLIFPINCQLSNSEFLITDIQLKNITQTQLLPKPNYKFDDIIQGINAYSERTDRWNYALDLWKTKYKWYHKLFGHGFDYISWYAIKFLGDARLNDYPHNPFITILLYSGLLGLFVYLWLLYKVIYLYLKYCKEYPIFFQSFLITFFFTFFSGGNPFDPPIMGFFILLPFLIHSIHKSDVKSINTI